MKLYKISQNVNNGYDTYDDAIVCAENEHEARKINPSEYYELGDDNMWYFLYHDGSKRSEGEQTNSWSSVDDVQVEYLGEAKEGLKVGVIVSSFNAG